MPYKILFYDDAPFFGGHEAMTLNAVEYITLSSGTDANVSFVFHSGNSNLRRRLEALAQKSQTLSLYPIEYRSRRLQHFRTMFSRRKICIIKSLIRQIDPDVVVVSQGGIGISSLGLVAAAQQGYKTISYIPMIHKPSITSSGMMNIRDLVTNATNHTKVSNFIEKKLYNMPNKFITVNRTTALSLTKITSKGVETVYNGIDINKYPIKDKYTSRKELGLPLKSTIVGLIGRIDFNQKGQDFLVETVHKFRHLLDSLTFLIVGSGPHEKQLRQLISHRHLEEKFVIISWNDNIPLIYSSIDMLVIPSKFEGLPLVMLEGMYYKLPVIASCTDGMAELLPPEWLFRPGDRSDFATRILSVLRNITQHENILERNHQTVKQCFTIESFGKNFFDALIS